MLNLETFTSALTKVGIYRCEEIDTDVKLYVSGSDNERHAYIVIDNYSDVVQSKAGVERAIEKAKATRQLAGADYKIAVIILDTQDNRKLMNVHNCIFVNTQSYAVRHGSMDSCFSKELSDIKASVEALRKEQLYKTNRQGLSSAFRDHSVFMTYVLAFICMGAFILVGTDNDIYAISENTYLAGERYRLFTYMFMHGSIIHIIVNMTSLVMVGRVLEKQIGALELTAVYVISGLIGAFASMRFGEGGDVYTVGASGAICGLIAANVFSVAFLPKQRHGTAIAASLFWLLSIFIYGSRAGIDNICHAGGAVGGALAALIICAARGIIFESDVNDAKKAHDERLSEMKLKMFTRNRSRAQASDLAL